VHAVDVSPTALALAQRRASEAAADRVTFVRGDLTALAFRDASVGAMFSWGVIIHIPEIERALDELVRVLRPGGRLALYVTNGACADDALRAVARSLVRRHRPQTRARLGTGAWYAMDDEQIWIWQLDVPALTAYLEERGLRCLGRLAGELTQLHIHLPRAVRPLFHRANNAWFKLRRRLPAWPTAMNLLVFEKRPA
jgi:SAM-dependent methyltransferase